MKDLAWRTSSFCESSGCVEVAPIDGVKHNAHVEVASLPDGTVLMRQSHSSDVVLSFTPAEWEVFVAGALNDEFRDM
jgi:hypothetical protein